MKRSPMKPRSEPMRRRTPLRPRSKKMQAKYDGDDGRKAFRLRILKERPMCEAGERIGTLMASVKVLALTPDGKDFKTIRIWERCRRRSRDVHEILARSAGGSILDEANVVAACRPCHDWCHEHPMLAMSLGLRKSRYDRG